MFIETLRIESEKVNEQFLLDLIDTGIEEGKTIDYKEKLPFTCHGANKLTWDAPDKEKLEFLKDVS